MDRFRTSHPGTFLIASLWFGAMLCCASLRADSVDATLAAASKAAAEGEYRAAHARLDELSAAAEQLPPDQQITYWNLLADVARDSGLFAEAEQAAERYLELLGRPAQVTGERAQNRLHSLVRLALIKRDLSGARQRGDASGESAARLLDEARGLLVEALRLRGGSPQQDPLWEAETRLEFARTLELLDRSDKGSNEARRAYDAASSAATVAIGQLKDPTQAAGQCVRGLAVVRQSFLDRDAATMKSSQARLALQQLEQLLKESRYSPSDRAQLLVARASCHEQLGETELEERALHEALEFAQRDPDDQKCDYAKIMVRLAALADVPVGPQARSVANQLYGEATKVYQTRLQEARTGKSISSNGKTWLARRREVECLLQLQLIDTRRLNWDRAIAYASELVSIRENALLANADPNYYRAVSALGALHARRARSARDRSVEGLPDFSQARNDVAEAQKQLKVAAQFWKQYQPKSPVDLSIALNYYAEVLRYDGEYQLANALLEEALPYFETMYDKTDERLGEFYSNRAAVLAALGQFVTAQKFYDQAIAVCKSDVPDDSRNRRQLLAMVYLNEAQLFKSQRQYLLAREMCAQASAAAERADFSAEDQAPFKLADAALQIIDAEQSLRQVRSTDVRAYDENVVRERLDDAFDTAQQVIDTLGQETMTLNLATAYHLQALARYQQARSCEAGKQQADAQAKVRWLRIADDRQQDLPGINVLRVRALNYLAVISLRDVKQSRSAALLAEDPTDVDRWKQLGGEQLRQAEHWSQAAEALSKRLAAYPAVQFQILLTRAQVLQAIAQIRRSQAKSVDADAAIAEAIDQLYAAIELIERPRAMTTGAEEERADYFSQFSPAFDMLVDLLVRQKRYVDGIEVAEQRRSRTFLDQFRASGVDLGATLPASCQLLVKQEQAIADEYYATLNHIREHPDDANLSDEFDRLKKLKDDRYEIYKQIASSSGAYRQLLIEPLTKHPAAADDSLSDAEWVRSRIGAGNVAWIYYLGSFQSYVFECSPTQGVQMHPLAVSADQAHRLGLRFDQTAGKPGGVRPLCAEDAASLVKRAVFSMAPEMVRNDRGTNRTIVRATKYRLEDLAAVTDMLVPPSLRKHLLAESARHLLIVPDGALHQLPFEALRTNTEGSAFLLDVLPPTFYAPSLEIFRELANDERRPGHPISVLSVADPIYDARLNAPQSAVLEKLSPFGLEFFAQGGTLAQLPGTKQESEAVCNAFEKSLAGRVRVVPLTAAEATESNVHQELTDSRFSYLHFAVHGLVDQKYQNLFGALALSTPVIPTPGDDGFLSLNEIMKLPGLDRCELAVLSACETNCGPARPLEAGSTMSRAFLCAGAQRVVCSHWSVSDEATTELVGKFLEDVAKELARDGPVDYAAALQAAKVRLRSNPRTGDPLYWAPFVLIGPPTGSSATRDDAPTATRN